MTNHLMTNALFRNLAICTCSCLVVRGSCLCRKQRCALAAKAELHEVNRRTTLANLPSRYNSERHMETEQCGREVVVEDNSVKQGAKGGISE